MPCLFEEKLIQVKQLFFFCRAAIKFLEGGAYMAPLWFECYVTGVKYCYRGRGVYAECRRCKRNNECSRQAASPKMGVSSGVVLAARRMVRDESSEGEDEE
jgi:hypothetical protein